MKRAAFFVLAAATVVVPGAGAQTSIGIHAAHDHLSNNTPDWRETTVQLQHQYGPRRNAGIALTQMERFGVQDNQISGMFAMPLSSVLVATAEASLSDTHRVLARNALGATLQYEFAPAWLAHGGVRTTDYDAARVSQGLLMLEHYFSSFSVAAGWRPARAFSTTAHSGELRANYYYQEKNSIGFIVAGGKEAANIAGNISLTSLRSAAIVGRHWLTRHWALNYSVAHTRQGDFYTRNGLSLGLQYAF
ncbi:hypothetical protein GCM10027343_25020 [Noviherbaspirillum agri]